MIVMNLHLPARRIAATVSQAAAGKPCLRLQYVLPQTQRRNISFKWGQKKPSTNPEEFKHELDKAKKLSAEQRQRRLIKQNMDRTGGDSIFDEELQAQEDDGEPIIDPAGGIHGRTLRAEVVKEHTQRALDPDPRWRVRFLKKKVKQMVRDADKPLTKAQRIKLSEKEHMSNSGVLPTSTKKLMFLSRQIVGKTVDEAITQMRFSKKKMAREVKWQLELARDEAITMRGMGLGAPDGKAFDKPRQIQTKDGRWLQVSDPTTLYVDQSWVGKHQWLNWRAHFMARGRTSAMWRPTASISIVVKEEKTRLRLHDDKVEKQAKKAPWVHLPNRPVTAQRQYYSW
ncbi:ribosomal protein L22 [Annulohypoxylon bovei var. microspora]|nr:ribosomal protein L22 [Annulohypoxylon bovei var. microspora]